MSFVDRDKLRELERRIDSLQTDIARTPIRLAKGAVSSNTANTMILATPVTTQVNPGDAEYTATVVSVEQGEETSSTVTAINRYGETIRRDVDFIPLWKRASDGKYVPDRTGGASGVVIWRFALNADFPLAQLDVPATEVDSGTVIQVVDPQGNFSGHTGYTGWAVKFTDEYLSTGRAGARIVTMDTPMRLLVVILSGSYSQAGTPVTIVSDQDVYGHPFEGQSPSVASFDVSDPYNIAIKAVVNDRWVVIYNEANDGYDFLTPITGLTKTMLRVKGTTGSTVSGTNPFTLNNLTLVGGTLPPGVTLPASITVKPTIPINIPNSTANVYAVQNLSAGASIADQWDAGDANNLIWHLKGISGFDATKFQLLTHDTGTLTWHTIAYALTKLEGWSTSSDQSIYGDASEQPEWKDDGVCPPPS